MNLYQNQRGAINVLLFPLILAIIFFFGAAGFAAWAYTEREDYKNNVDEKIAVAVKVAEDQLSTKKDNEFLEREKKPLKPYEGPAVFGDISFKYPKTWSGYYEEKDAEMELFFYPNLVSGNEDSKYALRLEVMNGPYQDQLRRYEGPIQEGLVRSSAFRLEKINSVLGIRLDGELEDGVNGSKILLPLRDKTIIISSESPEFIDDLDNIILPSFVFNP